MLDCLRAFKWSPKLMLLSPAALACSSCSCVSLKSHQMFASICLLFETNNVYIKYIVIF